MSSILLTPPAAEPVTLAGAKAYLRVEHDADDDVIAGLISGARLKVEALTRRTLITQTWQLRRDSWPGDGRLMVVPAPLREIVAVRVYDSGGAPHAVDLQAFTADTAAAPAVIGFVPWSLPVPGRTLAGIEIDFEAGYGDAPADVPQPLRRAIELLVAHWYEHRGLIAVGQSVAVLPASVAAMIAPYRVLSL
jgi:uncharacterized phiE125 gp8 family phage protein